MRFAELLKSLIEAPASTLTLLLRKAPVGDSWRDNETRMRKYRRRRARRNAMAYASRERNRGR